MWVEDIYDGLNLILFIVNAFLNSLSRIFTPTAVEFCINTRQN